MTNNSQRVCQARNKGHGHTFWKRVYVPRLKLNPEIRKRFDAIEKQYRLGILSLKGKVDNFQDV